MKLRILHVPYQTYPYTVQRKSGVAEIWIFVDCFKTLGEAEKLCEAAKPESVIKEYEIDSDSSPLDQTIIKEAAIRE